MLAVTWAAESGFKFNPDSQPNDGAVDNADIGPMQINYRTFHDWVGTTTTGQHRFDGNPYDNLRAGARILRSYGQGRNAAGLYRTGTGAFARTRVGQKAYEDRVGQYDQWAGGYNEFFKPPIRILLLSHHLVEMFHQLRCSSRIHSPLTYHDRSRSSDEKSP